MRPGSSPLAEAHAPASTEPYGAREIAVILDSGDARGRRLARVSLTISTQHLFFYVPLRDDVRAAGGKRAGGGCREPQTETVGRGCEARVRQDREILGAAVEKTVHM